MHADMLLKTWLSISIAVLALAAIPVSALAGDPPQAIVDAAVTTLTGFRADESLPGFQQHLRDANGILIVPSLPDPAGAAVMLVRVPGTRKWSYPAFFSIGAQATGDSAGEPEQVLLIMTDKGQKAMLGDNVRLGADISVAAGSRAGGTTDLLRYTRGSTESRGLDQEAAAIAARDDWNRVYYGKTVTQSDILFGHEVQKAGADRLRHVIAGAATQ